MYGRGYARGRGMGLGFRGSSPPWPYIGRGRGGLPRCGYYFGSTVTPVGYPFPRPINKVYAGEPQYPAYAPFNPPMTGEQELGFLKEQAGVIKDQLEQIEARINNLKS